MSVWRDRRVLQWSVVASVFAITYLPFGPVRRGNGNACSDLGDGQQLCTMAYDFPLESLLGLRDDWLLVPFLAAVLSLAVVFWPPPPSPAHLASH